MFKHLTAKNSVKRIVFKRQFMSVPYNVNACALLYIKSYPIGKVFSIRPSRTAQIKYAHIGSLPGNKGIEL